jgi:hypothetical protein
MKRRGCKHSAEKIWYILFMTQLSNKEDNLSPIGSNLLDSMNVFVGRLYAIKKYVERFSKEFMIHDIDEALLRSRRQLAILESIDNAEDQHLKEDISKTRKDIKYYSETKEKIISGVSVDSEFSDIKEIGKIQYGINLDNETFYFDPSILPSSFSPLVSAGALFSYVNFLRTQFVNLITEFELLLSKIAKVYYLGFEGSLDKKEVKIRLEEIKKFASISEIKEHLVESEIFKLTSGGLDEWREFLKEKFGVEFEKVTPDWELFKKYFYQRNLFIHNDGIINEDYIRKSGRTDIKLGDQISINKRDLSVCLENFLIVGSTIALMTWNKLSPKEKAHISENINDLGYHALMSNHWEFSERLYTLLDMYGGEDDKIISKMNKYLCLKRKGRFNEIKEELESFNHNTYNPKYSLVVYALLDDCEKALSTINQADMSLGDLIEWPILEDLRKIDPFKKYMKTRLQTEAIQKIEVDRLSRYTLTELKIIAASNSLKIKSSMKKENIITLLEEHSKKQKIKRLESVVKSAQTSIKQ